MNSKKWIFRKEGGIVRGTETSAHPVQVKRPYGIKCPYGLSFVEVFSFLTEKLAPEKFQVSQQPQIGFDLYSIADRQSIFPVLPILLWLPLEQFYQTIFLHFHHQFDQVM